jgi:prepilin-type processing-associated H-X9-DG protein
VAARRLRGNEQNYCAGTQASAYEGNFAPVAYWHSGGSNVGFFDGHVKRLKESTIRTPPAQYADDLSKWKLWFAFD